MRLVRYIEDVYTLLADHRIEKLGLFHIHTSKIIIPLEDDAILLFNYRSRRMDEFVELPIVRELISAIKTSQEFKRINHIGFCYKVTSKEREVKRITDEASDKGHSVYQEPSSDNAAWVFVGDISKISNPLLEFLPHEGKGNDEWIDYWLPHIQFDVDTGLSPHEIDVLVKRFIQRPATPYSIQIDGVTYIQRVNLGCIEGINIMLDLSTNNRDINYRKYWDVLA